MRESSCSGRGPREFPRTTFGGAAPDAARMIPDLARRYWVPICRYIEAITKSTHHDAKDLTQAFFVWLLESPALSRYEPERGRFRPYLKLLIRHFLEHERRARGALKRGGAGRRLDAAPEPAAVGSGAEEAFDRAWWTTLVRLALDRVRERLEASGRGDRIRLYEAFDLSESPPTYAEAARTFGITEGEVRGRLAQMRSRVREEVRAELLRLTSSEAELRDEWKALFGRR